MGEVKNKETKMRTVKVEVTQEDIDEGQIAWREGPRCSTCPVAVAVAVRRAYKNANVGLTRVSMPGGNGLLTLSLPQSATDFIERADQNLPLQPFSFDIEDLYPEFFA